MKLFECQNCRQPLYFENTRCEHCGLRLGYLSDQEVVTALHPLLEFGHEPFEPVDRIPVTENLMNAPTSSSSLFWRGAEQQSSFALPIIEAIKRKPQMRTAYVLTLAAASQRIRFSSAI